MAAPSITRTSLSTPASFAAGAPTSGGSLAASTTYYYKIIAVLGSGTSPSTTIFARSAPSSEISGTTTGTNKTIPLTWSAVSGATGYIVWRTTQSGDYEHRYVEGGGNLFRCQALRSAFNVFTTTGTSYNDNGAVQTSGYQSLTHYHYLDFEIPQFLVSGGDSTTPFNMEYLYQQDVTNGWGNITRSGDAMLGYVYDIHGAIRTTSYTYWKETYTDDIWNFWGSIYMNNTSNDVWIGYEAENLEWVYGRRINIYGHYGYNSLPEFRLGGTSTGGIFGTHFVIKNNLRFGRNYVDNPNSTADIGLQNGIQRINITGAIQFRGNSVIGATYSTGPTSPSSGLDISRCSFFTGNRPFELGAGTLTNGSYSDLLVRSNSRTIGAEHRTATLQGVQSYSLNGNAYTMYYGDNDLTVIDCLLDGNYFVGSGTSVAPGAQLTQQTRLNLTVLDKNGDPVVGATVKIIDNVPTTQVSATTDANGQISELVTLYYFIDTGGGNRNFYVVGGTDERTYYGPFELQITADGYEDYVQAGLEFVENTTGQFWTVKIGSRYAVNAESGEAAFKPNENYVVTV